MLNLPPFMGSAMLALAKSQNVELRVPKVTPPFLHTTSKVLRELGRHTYGLGSNRLDFSIGIDVSGTLKQ